MLVRMQKAAQSWVAKTVAFIIIIVLVLFGFGAFNLFAVNEPTVASVNGQDITERQLASEIERSKQNFRATYGTQYSDQQIDEWIDEEFALRRVVDGTLFSQATAELKLTLSEQQFNQTLKADPQFQIDGSFDEALFRETLERNNISTRTLKGIQEESDVRAQLLGVIEDTEFATSREVRLLAKLDKQERDISALSFRLEEFEDQDSVLEEDIQEYFESHSDDFMTEGTFDFEYVEIERELFVKESELTEDEIQGLYDAEVLALESSAERRGRHILIKVDSDRTQEEALEEINAIRDRLVGGEDFAEIASELSEDVGSKEDGGDLGFAARSKYVKEFSDSLWSLDVNEVSDPVETQFGYHLIELLEIESVEILPLEERRDDLVSEHQLELASSELSEVTEEVDKLAFEQADSLQPIADAYEVDIQTIAGVDSNSNEGVFSQYSVRTAFMDTDVIDSGFNSRVVEIGDTSIVVGRLTGRTEPSLKSIDQVSDEIKQTLVRERAIETRDDLHAETLEKLLDDRDYDAAEKVVEENWVVFERQTRGDFSVDPAILDAAFAVQLPVDDEKVITEAVSEFSDTLFIVVVSRQKLADYSVLETAVQQELDERALSDAKTQALASFIAGLRLDASIKTDRVAYTPVVPESE